jgi:hypothetical protein
VEAGGGAGEVALLGDGHERLELAELHSASLVLSPIKYCCWTSDWHRRMITVTEGGAMQQIRLGRSDLMVSRVAFGTWQLGGDWGATDERQAIAAIRRAADLGVTLFDTAQGYGFGASERLLAKALHGRARDEIVLATKGGLRPAGTGVARDASPAWIRKGVDDSL